MVLVAMVLSEYQFKNNIKGNIMILTQTQLITVEAHSGYQNELRGAVLSQSAYWKGNNGVGLATPDAVEEWYRKRQLSENVLSYPNQSIDRAYWSSRSLSSLKTMDVADITEDSTADEIVEAISDTQWEQLAIFTFSEESKKILF